MLGLSASSNEINSPLLVHAELTGSNTCKALGVTAQGATPVLKLCRQLLASGLDPDAAMEVYRRGVLALRVRTIAEAAGLEINATGTDFVACAVRRGSSVRENGTLKEIGQPAEGAP
jgi:hypothetical protein